ncbi:DUF1186 domain-containing protein [Lentibacillus sp. CBA3610]|uniref:DUF1186 domain-containing protein n=1 Tax=Lentibacillus sp. CBA3610 TaxID=2518176 RepID=UPI001595AF0B|nr:DUF1186 domain-containing protein [Lentibacillus sp. CBA3610]
MENLFEKISYNDGRFPKKELESIIEQKETYIPELLSVAEEVRANPEKYMDMGKNGYMGHIYAFFMLAQFRVKPFYPVFNDLLRLPKDDLNLLMGDFLTEYSGRAMASLYEKPEDIGLLKELIEDETAYEFARGQAMRALVILVLNGKLKRDEVLEYFRSLLKRAVHQPVDPYVVTEIICCASDLYPDELYEDIKQVYDLNLVITGIITLNDIDRDLANDKEIYLENQRRLPNSQLIESTVDEMQNWASFYKDRKAEKKRKGNMSKNKTKLKFPSTNQPFVNENKTGRNDPCPCGSGKKYKKCCGV